MSDEIASEFRLPQSPKRVFPLLYRSTGDASVDRLAFVHILERLKTQKRTGWVDHNVGYHMYRMAMLAMCSSDPELDISKCVMMCIVHDLAEAHVGDIAPSEGISKAEKTRRESEAMRSFVYDMLHATPAALRIEALWKEYEEGHTPEARFVKALEYETKHNARTLQPFFDSSLPIIRHPEIKCWGADLSVERDRLHAKPDEHSLSTIGHTIYSGKMCASSFPPKQA
ncbi:hypothetical protein L208DRAFT_1426925 [Tricholoma matsutake]|nr:hypothetical protein L208DRAFT_1426925 [Tricholoma matsutake 945]